MKKAQSSRQNLDGLSMLINRLKIEKSSKFKAKSGRGHSSGDASDTPFLTPVMLAVMSQVQMVCADVQCVHIPLDGSATQCSRYEQRLHTSAP